ncbi:MAG TPA: hypothetical protein VFQ23_01710 [Anaerolineales bacterium]|nr:hypothetical protein [Anaerolineales bacterium]
MNNKWKWTVGTALAVILLALLLLSVQGFFPRGAYHMMNGYSWQMPMMYGGGMMGFGMAFLMWLILFGVLILIGLGIAWLVKALTITK